MDLEIITYNCYSVRNKVQIIKTLCESFDIICLQEILLPESEVHFLNKISNNHFSYFYVKDKISDDINVGRPSRGVCFLIRNNLAPFVSPIYVNDRIIGITLKIGSKKYLIINVYMPVDKRTLNSFDEFKNTLALVEALILENNTNNIVILGDFNAHPQKPNLWSEINLFTDDYSLVSLDSEFPNDTFTYLSPNNLYKSWLDHIFCSKHLRNSIANLEVLYGVALDDHMPVAFTFHITLDHNIKQLSYRKDNSTYNTKEFVLWNKLTEKQLDDYSNMISKELDFIDWFKAKSFYCFDVKCCDQSHLQEIKVLFNLLMNIIKKASVTCFFTSKRCDVVIPGWNDYVKSFYNEARSCFLKWREAGSPSFGVLANQMKHTKKLFRIALRKCKANEYEIKNEKIVKALKEKNSKNFWKQVRNLKQNQDNRVLKIDDYTDYKDICELFSKKFKQVFDDANCQSCDSNISSTEIPSKSELRYFTPHEIKAAIQNLNPSIGPDNVHSNHFKYAPYKLCSVLSKIFSACYNHAALPSEITSGIINPLVKNQFGDIENSSNYRPIISSSISFKIIEHVIKQKIEKFVITDCIGSLDLKNMHQRNLHISHLRKSHLNILTIKIVFMLHLLICRKHLTKSTMKNFFIN